MNEISRYVPAYVETDEPIKRASFDTLAQLTELPLVRRFTDDKDFYKLSASDNHLIAEYRGGRNWSVVGSLREAVPGLPEWDHGIYEVIDPSGKPLVVPGRDVASSCGDEVKLRDGRILKWCGPDA